MEEEEANIEVEDDDSSHLFIREQEQDDTDQEQAFESSLARSYESVDVGEHKPQEASNLAASSIGASVDCKNDRWTYWNKAAVIRDGFQIQTPQVKEPWDYVVYVEPQVSEVLEEYNEEPDVSYLVSFTDDHMDEVCNIECFHFVT